jgi:hypothetical protein
MKRVADSVIAALLITIAPLLLAQNSAAVATIHELFLQDQQDQQIDNEALSAADQKKLRMRYDDREQRVKQLMQTSSSLSAQDLFNAGVILTHSHNPENQLLAHLAFTAAGFEGNAEAKHLAATSLDRYQVLSHQTPIFGTTFQRPYQGWHHEVSPDMNDAIRSAFCLPSLSQLNKLYELEKAGKAPPDSGHDQYWNTDLKGCQPSP